MISATGTEPAAGWGRVDQSNGMSGADGGDGGWWGESVWDGSSVMWPAQVTRDTLMRAVETRGLPG